MKNYKNIPKYGIITYVAISLALLSFLTWLGFGETKARIVQCDSSVTRYVMGNFSKWETHLDLDGDLDTEIVRWDELASEVYNAYTINGKLYETRHSFIPSNAGSYFVPPQPKHNLNMRHWGHFDRFSYHRNSWLKVHITLGGEPDHFKEPVEDTVKCIEKIDTKVTIKRWYTISYGSDWK